MEVIHRSDTIVYVFARGDVVQYLVVQEAHCRRADGLAQTPVGSEFVVKVLTLHPVKIVGACWTTFAGAMEFSVWALGLKFIGKVF